MIDLPRTGCRGIVDRRRSVRNRGVGDRKATSRLLTLLEARSHLPAIAAASGHIARIAATTIQFGGFLFGAYLDVLETRRGRRSTTHNRLSGKSALGVRGGTAPQLDIFRSNTHFWKISRTGSIRMTEGKIKVSDDQADSIRDYACAIGSAILALNDLESEVSYLLDILGAAQPSLERAYFIKKIGKLEAVARQQADAKTRERLEKIASKARWLADERNNFAHGLLWIDAFTGEHKRRFVRRSDRKVFEDARPPEEIEGIAFCLTNLAADVRDLAMELGGLERWEEYARSLDT